MLRNYLALIALTDADLKTEAVARLREYVQEGGTLVLDARNRPPALDARFLGAATGAETLLNAPGCRGGGRTRTRRPVRLLPARSRTRRNGPYRAGNGDAVVTRHVVGQGGRRPGWGSLADPGTAGGRREGRRRRRPSARSPTSAAPPARRAPALQSFG